MICRRAWFHVPSNKSTEQNIEKKKRSWKKKINGKISLCLIVALLFTSYIPFPPFNLMFIFSPFFPPSVSILYPLKPFFRMSSVGVYFGYFFSFFSCECCLLSIVGSRFFIILNPFFPFLIRNQQRPRTIRISRRQSLQRVMTIIKSRDLFDILVDISFRWRSNLFSSGSILQHYKDMDSYS